MSIPTPKQTNHEIETEKYKVSLVSDIDVELSCAFNVE